MHTASPRSRALLALLGAQLLVPWLGGCTSEPAPAFPAPTNILLITVDTLRADRLSCYGHPRQTSPTIDRLAAEGVRFEQPWVQWPKTGPSMASMFTATYPKDNDITRRVGIPLPQSFLTLPEVLHRRGYGTHGIVANGALGSEFFFDQGFDSYLETWKIDGAAELPDPNRADVVTNLGIELLDEIDPQRPFFLWLHYLDPHFPYTPPGPWSDHFADDDLNPPEPKIHIFHEKQRNQMAGIGAEQVLDGRDELSFYRRRYDAEIAFTDTEIARFLEELTARGLDSNTLTVFTSDHGESLGEHHYYFDHGRFSFQTCLRVPLIFHLPGTLEPRVDPAPVQLLDLAPTLLQAAGAELEDGAWMQGRSLLPRLFGEEADSPPAASDGEAPAPTLAFAEAGYETGGFWQKVVRDDRFKLIYAESRPEQRWIGGVGVRFVLYDLLNDPEETVNVADQFPEEVERLKRELWRWNKAPKFPVGVDPLAQEETDEEMDPETRKLLESLGYL